MTVSLVASCHLSYFYFVNNQKVSIICHPSFLNMSIFCLLTVFYWTCFFILWVRIIIKYNYFVNICFRCSYQSLCSVRRNPPRFQTSTPMRKHGPTTCLAWTPAGVLTPQLLPCSHGRKAAIVRPTPAQKVSQWFNVHKTLTTFILSIR